jgi:hypothetical protein
MTEEESVVECLEELMDLEESMFMDVFHLICGEG